MKAQAAIIMEEVVVQPILRSRVQPAASVVGVSKFFGKTGVLQDISFDVAEGEALVLLGASGSGKTTILRIIAGLEQPYTGKVMLHGKDVTELPARERGVGVIFQAYALFPKMTVEKNIGYGLMIRRRKRKEIKEDSQPSFSLWFNSRSIARNILHNSQAASNNEWRLPARLPTTPKCCLFDEPFGALDAQTRVHLRREIRALLKKVNVPAIFITHDQEEALELGDRIAVINVGHIEQIGTPAEVYNNPATEYVATFLGAANILEGIIRNDYVEVGTARIPAPRELQRFREGQAVKVIFRPEDVSLRKTQDSPSGRGYFATGIVEELSFVGAYERVRIRLEPSGGEGGDTGETPYYLTTEPPESPTAKPIIATRPKPESAAVKLYRGDRLFLGLTTFTILPKEV